MIGETILGYKVIKKLGQGGMGTVYMAYDTRLERHIALKVLNPELNKDKVFLSRFQSEAKLLAKLNHQNITILYNLIEHKDRWIMVMEYVDGVSVEQYLCKKPDGLKQNLVIKIVKEVLTGLHYAHSKGIIHRDIKPGNIMIDSKGKVKLMDFGIAINKDSKRHTKVGNIVGSIEYIAPELIKGAEPSAQTDIYSLGIVMYEMLEGKVPFASTNDYEIMDSHLHTKPPKITKQIDSSVLKIVNKALNKKPKRRYLSAQEFYHAFDNYKKTLDIPLSGKNKLFSDIQNRLTALFATSKGFISNNWLYLIGALSIVILSTSIYSRYSKNEYSNNNNSDISLVDNNEKTSIDRPNFVINNMQEHNSIVVKDTQTVTKDKSKTESVLSRKLELADRLFKRKKFLPPGENLSNLCKQLLKKYPGNTKIKDYVSKMIAYYKAKGDKYIKRKKWKSALREFEKVLLIDQSNDYANRMISFIKKKLKRESPLVKHKKNEDNVIETGLVRNESNSGEYFEEKEKSDFRDDKKEKAHETKQDPKPIVNRKNNIETDSHSRTKKVKATIKYGMKIIIGLDEDINTEQNRSDGESVRMHVKNNVYNKGKLVFEAGSPVKAVLTKFKSSLNRKKGLIEVKVKSIQAKDGSWIDVRRSTFRTPGRRGQKINYSPGMEWIVFTAERKKITY